MSSHEDLIIKVTTAMVVVNSLRSTFKFKIRTGSYYVNKEIDFGLNAFTVGAGLMAGYMNDPTYLLLNSLILVTLPSDYL